MESKSVPALTHVINDLSSITINLRKTYLANSTARSRHKRRRCAVSSVILGSGSQDNAQTSIRRPPCIRAGDGSSAVPETPQASLDVNLFRWPAECNSSVKPLAFSTDCSVANSNSITPHYPNTCPLIPAYTRIDCATATTKCASGINHACIAVILLRTRALDSFCSRDSRFCIPMARNCEADSRIQSFDNGSRRPLRLLRCVVLRCPNRYERSPIQKTP
jgi:hypothetical protein